MYVFCENLHLSCLDANTRFSSANSGNKIHLVAISQGAYTVVHQAAVDKRVAGNPNTFHQAAATKP